MLARYYSAQLGRFLSVDPSLKIGKNLDDPQRWNRYTYSRNNPIKFFDPDGRDAVISGNSQTKTLNLTVNVVLAGGTAQQATKFQNDANAKWGGQNTVTAKDGSKWTMNVQVNATNDPSKFKATDNPNTIQVSDSGKTEMTSSTQGTANSKDLENPTTAGHETGHMLGVGDQYNKDTGNPNPGKEGSMMGDPKNPDAQPTQEEKNEVANKALAEKKDKNP